MASWGLVVFGILQSSPASEMISFIEKGHCQHVRFHATPWSINGGGWVEERIGNVNGGSGDDDADDYNADDDNDDGCH